ncbi:NTE family protein [Evansella vedderi]|uniref:NTE family protein n=1 Tax=Evansella vedderi TaxID=38282 RepID=A0ABU0A1P4_9BACI|nr:patatin-like phospholipase family protein [Evansella vedderi]MDQ0256270.1 NTE family protein [Evansella vedderi]
MLQVDGVFAGGGIKAFSFVGAMKALEEEGIYFERLAGTSAGAIVATLIKAGFTSNEIEKILDEVDLISLLDRKHRSIPFYRWIRLYLKMGIYKGDAFEDWLNSILKEKGIRTFGDIPPGTLKMIVSDVTNGRLVVLPDDLAQYGIIPESFSVARAIRMSCCIPFFFEPVKITSSKGIQSVMVDGGVLSNFPIWLFSKQGQTQLQRPVIGFRLSPSEDTLPPREVKNAFSMLHSMVETMWKAHDQRYISKSHAKNIVFIPANKVPATKFDISEEEKDALIQLGKETTEKFLKKWAY